MTLTVAITGGARGIGRATTEASIREGMSVIIGDVNGGACAAVAAQLRSFGQNLSSISGPNRSLLHFTPVRVTPPSVDASFIGP